jgi:HSP20 family protein
MVFPPRTRLRTRLRRAVQRTLQPARVTCALQLCGRELRFSFLMDPIKSIKLRWLQDALHDVSYELSRSQFSRFAAQAWRPAINAYRCDTCIRICVDLAGVDRSLIDLTVEQRRLVIRGTRELPEPTGDEGCAQQLLAMEIDYGPFEREITFPVDVEIDKAHAEQRNGLLWISLPVTKQS